MPTRVARVDGKPMAWRACGALAGAGAESGEVIISYRLLTVNATNHALLHRIRPARQRKSMPAILNEGAYDAWFTARPDKAKEFMRQYAAQSLLANPVEQEGGQGAQAISGLNWPLYRTRAVRWPLCLPTDLQLRLPSDSINRLGSS